MIEIGAFLISLNIVIGLAYTLLALLVILVPVKFKFLRALSYPGVLLAAFITVFLIACGWHHFDMASHLSLDYSLNGDEDLYHFIAPDVLQVITAFGAAIVGALKGRFMFDRLYEEFEKHRNGEVELMDGEDDE